jgi:hypothetical protein
MTFTFKLSRRIAMFRALAPAVLLAALAACAGDTLGPDDSSGLPSSHPATDLTPGSATFAGGIPFGYFGQPTEAYGAVFNGASRIIYTQFIVRELADMKARGGKVALKMAGGDKFFKDANGSFNLAKWKERVDLFRDVNIAPYVNDGTLIGHYLIDEPNDPANWNGKPISPSTLEEMARYSKSIWPDLPTIVRTEPDYLSSSHKYLDAAWAQYLDRKGNPQDFIRRNVADAQERGLGLVVGLNVLHGGTPTGTKMTPSQVVAWGSALLSSTYPCAFISWTYDEQYLGSSGVMGAMSDLRRLAQNRSARSCRRAGTSGGQTPPPPPPPEPPSEPPSEPPAEPPTPTAGVPFGPYGLPTSELASFSGSLRSVSPDNVLATVRAARQAGARVILRMAVSGVTAGDGTFSLTKWKAVMDRYARLDLASFVGDGTIAGHIVVQDPHNARKWGGRQISHATLDEMARYSRQLWPALPTLAHAPAEWLAGNAAAWRYLDASSVTYSGSLGDAGTWVNRQASAAGRARLGLLVGMNVLNGGTSASRLPGTTSGKYAMSASQLRTWGTAMLAPSQVCGLVLSRYDSGYFGRADVKDALGDLRAKAGSRAATSCRARA